MDEPTKPDTALTGETNSWGLVELYITDVWASVRQSNGIFNSLATPPQSTLVKLVKYTYIYISLFFMGRACAFNISQGCLLKLICPPIL